MQSRNIVFSILFFLFCFSTSFSQQMGMPGRETVCPADPDHHEFYLAPPKRYLNSSNKARTSSTGGANFVVTYNGFSEEAQIAFQKAVDIWSSILNSDVTIYIDASWEPLGQGVLGSAGPGTLYRDFENAPLQNTWYCVALAEKIARKELNESGSPDITSRFNSSFDWYLGTDGSPGLKYDLVTVVLHEIGHGLGFAAYGTDVSGSTGSWDLSAGFAGMYSPYIVDGEGVRLLDLENGSAVAGDYLESNDLYLDNELVVLANNNVLPKIYAPTTYNGGSSISHWDDATFDGTDNALMTHAVASGEAMHDPGINTLSVFADMGWIVSGYNHQPSRIANVNEPFTISTSIYSDTTISSKDLEVHYLYEGTEDTIIVAMNEVSEDHFEISIDLDAGYNSLSYYISGLSDDLNRSYTSPSKISNGWYSVSLESYLLLEAPYTISDGGGFETNQEHFSASSTSSNYKLWELGAPSDKFSGLTGSTVWETNLEGPIGKPATETDNLLYSQFFDLSDATMDYVLKFDYAMEVYYDGQLSVITSIDSSRTKMVLGENSRDLGVNWYDDESYFGSKTLDSDGNLEIRTVEYPLYELVGNKPLLGFSFYVGGLYSADSVYAVSGAMIDNFEVIVSTPKARFYASEHSIFPGSEVQFHYASNGAESFVWDFGDGTTSSERNPTHVYEDGGSYDVTLTIQYPGGGTDTQVREGYINFIEMKGSSYSLENGGDFETNEGDFVAINVSGTQLTRGKSSVEGKAGTHSGDNAWVFGLEDAIYENDSEAYLYTSLFDFQIIGDYTLSFYANYSFENEWDGFVVEYSTDLGASWERLNEDVEGDWYDVISDPSAVFGNRVPIFSGTTNNQFVLKSTDVSFLGGAADPIVFRFLVLTDAAELDVGLALDDFTLTGPLLEEVVPDLSGQVVSGDEGCEGQTLAFTSNSTGSIVAIDWDFGEQAAPRTASGVGPHQVAFGAGESTVLMTITDIDALTTSVDTLISTGEDHDAEITSVNNNNGSFTLTASDGDTFLWYFDDEVLEGITTQEYTTFENGEYTVEIAKGSCVRSSSIERLTVAGLSLANSDVNIAPNPVSTELLIQNSTQYQNAELRLFDLSGKLILKKSFNKLNEDIKVSLSGVENGIYLVQVIFDQKYLYGSRLIKE